MTGVSPHAITPDDKRRASPSRTRTTYHARRGACYNAGSPMTVIHAGALLDRGPGAPYVAAFRFAEIAPAEPLPRAGTLERWRETIPEGFVTSFVVPSAARKSAKGAFRFDDEMTAAFEWAVRAAEILRARFVVVPTGSELTTGQRDRDLLSAWVERFGATTERRIVWHPTGLWDREIALPFARKLGVLLAFDPLEAEPPAGPLLYARLRAIGLRTRFDETMLLDVLDALQSSDAEEAFIAIESGRAIKEASRLAALAVDDA